MNWKRKSLLAAIGLTVLLGSAVSASAETQWERNHPRREQVVDRIHNQSLRITRERREGEMTARQAHYLRHEDGAVLHQERRNARFNDGRITKHEQVRLNREENGVSRQIGR